MQEKDFRDFESHSRAYKGDKCSVAMVLPSESDLVTVCGISQLDPPWRSFWCPATRYGGLCPSLVKLYINIHTLKLSPGTVHCKHCIVPQFTLMRMIYIYIALFIPMDLRVPHRLKYPRLYHSDVSWLWCEPARQDKCT